MDLLPHNKKAYNAVKKHLKASNRTCVIHPTGTGKSMIALQLIEDKARARILYITSVATNLMEFWDKVESLGNRRMVLSLSQSSIPKVADGEFKGELDGAEDGAEDGANSVADSTENEPKDRLVDNGIILEADEDSESEKISYEDRQRMLKKATEFDETYLTGPVIQFCLYAGLDNLLPDFDLIIVDEFHRAGAPQWEKQVRRILDENASAKVVGFSATPNRMDGKDMRSLFNYDVASEMKLSSTIATGLLPLPHYWLGKIEIDELDEEQEFKKRPKNKNRLRKRGYPTLAKRHFEAGSGLKEAFREAFIPEHAEHGKFIIFCRTIRNTRTLMKASEEWFDWIDEVHRYEMHSEDRNGFSNFIADTSDSLRLLFVVDMLTEGVHMEDLDGVIMVRPTESERVYFQQLGRALAVTTQRENPIVFDLVSNAGVMKSGMDFWREVGQEMGLEEADNLGKFFHITAEAADFISYVEETEYDYYSAMKEFYEEYGHLYIPPGYRVDDHDVYAEFLRIRNNRGSLSGEYKKKYEDIGMDWEITYQWMKGFWACQSYFEEHGNLDVPSTYEPEDPEHGVWLYDFLKRCRLKKAHMYERQIMMLDSLGMDWTIIDPWEEMFEALVAFREKHGHCDVPGDDGQLGYWVAYQRKHKPSDDKVERLNGLGFEWDGRKSRSRNAWREGTAHLIPYYEKYGNIKVPAGFTTSDGYKLGNFVKKAMGDGRYEELEEEIAGDSSTAASTAASKVSRAKAAKGSKGSKSSTSTRRKKEA